MWLTTASALTNTNVANCHLPSRFGMEYIVGQLQITSQTDDRKCLRHDQATFSYKILSSTIIAEPRGGGIPRLVIDILVLQENQQWGNKRKGKFRVESGERLREVVGWSGFLNFFVDIPGHLYDMSVRFVMGRALVKSSVCIFVNVCIKSKSSNAQLVKSIKFINSATPRRV